ncbi:MAG: hypothetical protein QME81_20910, partial [bacterium]|nr:hypothetical protein [bacterium]
FENYQLEGIGMPYTMEDFKRDYTKEHLNLLTPEEVLPRFSAEEIKAYLEKLERRQTYATRSKRDSISKVGE